MFGVAALKGSAEAEFEGPVVPFLGAAFDDADEVVAVEFAAGAVDVDDFHFVVIDAEAAEVLDTVFREHHMGSVGDDLADVFPIEAEEVEFIAIELELTVVESFEVSLEPFAGGEFDPVEAVGEGDVLGGLGVWGLLGEAGWGDAQQEE
ncbi:MAG: hypothetical protein RI897_3880 [Verrucomicrobiota bacterium]